MAKKPDNEPRWWNYPQAHFLLRTDGQTGQWVVPDRVKYPLYGRLLFIAGKWNDNQRDRRRRFS